ncbi:MAG: heavy metal translocating P-type ATPase [Armatimonadetes bacterium]|nr:heavy metal translocating P-type ATPase [Armatimonadota bacterium]
MVETKTISLPVTLPTGFEECGRCISRLRDALVQVDGVVSVEVSPRDSTMTLVYDPHLASLDDVERRAASIGVELRERFDHKTFSLVGLDCPDCALKLEKGVGRLDGVLWVSTNFASASMSVEYEPDKVDVAAISKRVRDMGYNVREPGRAPAAELGGGRRVPGRRRLERQTVLTIIAGAGLAAGLTLSWQGIGTLAKAAYAVAAIAGGLYAARGALFSIRSLVLDMNVLMTVAAIGAVAIGEWFDAAMVMFLFSLGNALEARTIERARQSVRSLVDLFPTQACVRRDGQETVIPANDVRVGDLFIVRPGEKIPTDGVVQSGSSTVNQASITGESAPVEKSPGEKVFAGSINHRGSIDVTATATTSDNTLARILHLVEEAQAEKAPTQRFTERFGMYYTPAVIALAVMVAVLPPLLFGAEFRHWIYVALTLLVVSCPCALVISTPVTIVSAIGNAARNGVLIKGGSHLEAAGHVRVVAFDKTGTITTGEARVTDVIPLDGFDADEVLSLAAGVESRSEHPLAEAIRRETANRNIPGKQVTDFEALTGMGAAAKFNGDTCVVGNSRLMEQLDIDLSGSAELLSELQGQGKTAVLVASGRRLAGIIALQDTLRETARASFRLLKSGGIERIVMITGDNEATARAVARDLDIDEYYAELLPQDKVDIVRLLIERFGSRVAFVGDGVNDAPALAAATVGIAMGAAGSDTALETADIALMSDDLGRLPYMIGLSRTALRTVKQNISFALVVIAVLICGALIGRLTLSLGVFGHEGSALIVIANGMRMLGFRWEAAQ